MASKPQLKLFVDKFRSVAIDSTKGTKLNPDTVLTVAGVESAYGLSKLARMDNNFFGIKAGSTWKGKKTNYPTKEIVNGLPVMINAYFRSYTTPLDSFKDYVKLITGSVRYKPVLAANSPSYQFIALQKSGYSTNPDYPKTLDSVLHTLSPYFTAKTVAIGGGGLLALLGIGLALIKRKKKG